MEFFDFEYELVVEFKILKKYLAMYQTISIKNEDLENTSFKMELYSNDINISRSQEDSLIYLFDPEDGSEGAVDLSDLKIILNNVAERITNQKKQAIELEEFLSEWYL